MLNRKEVLMTHYHTKGVTYIWLCSTLLRLHIDRQAVLVNCHPRLARALDLKIRHVYHSKGSITSRISARAEILARSAALEFC